jgi:Flp pilus assembly protein TadD
MARGMSFSLSGYGPTSTTKNTALRNSAAANLRLTPFMATHSEARFRDGEQAVRLAARAAELTRPLDASALDTLAAAYAEAGRFSEAIETARKAVSLAELSGEAPLIQDIRGRLELYEKQQPFREVSKR